MSNPFSLFDLPVQFAIDQNLLAQRYLRLQKTLHPDNFAQASVQEQRLAMQKSAEINDALQILKDPILRAEKIIALNCEQVKDPEQKSSHDMAFLMQQMQWREQLEEIAATKAQDALDELRREVEEKQGEMLNEVERLLTQKQWQQADGLCDKLRFMQKLLEEIDNVEEQQLAY
ncbi:co-chaperone protein HscB [Mesocricetibacter intestinalis]|uniref:Co-chaperone protein HscB homolog n=1 Tax=Mesocricetibacter intestinalis TaxID=1521930 RepID=A0A4R6VFN9_9PAST|nr:Fe-S protein assembly co-chaperone HscB [Mesocricetibacter intestinalis]TDQ59682.1 co-chaperone protein HscB [Mesocricetibacter intestinalis]